MSCDDVIVNNFLSVIWFCSQNLITSETTIARHWYAQRFLVLSFSDLCDHAISTKSVTYVQKYFN